MLNNDIINLGFFEGYGRNYPLELTAEERTYHTYLVGQTGVGKSSLLKYLLLQDIFEGRGCGLIDPHGDLARELLDFIPKSRINDVVYFEPADADYPFSFNLLQVDSAEHASVVAAGIVAAFKSVWRDSWGQNLDYYLENGIMTVLEGRASLLDVSRVFTDPTYRTTILERVKSPVLQNFWHNEFGKRGKVQQMESIAPILNRIGKLGLNPMVRNIFGQVHGKISARQILDRGHIFIANLSKGEIGEDKSSLIGALLVNQFFQAAMSRSKIPRSQRRPFYLTVDEFQTISTTTFAAMLAEARKQNLCLTLAHQFMGQLDPALRTAILGTTGTLVSFRVGEADAEVLSRQYGDGYAPDRFTMLKNFEVCAKLVSRSMHTDPVVGTTYHPSTLEHARQGHRSKIVQRSRQRYARRRVVVEKALDRTMGVTG